MGVNNREVSQINAGNGHPVKIDDGGQFTRHARKCHTQVGLITESATYLNKAPNRLIVKWCQGLISSGSQLAISLPTCLIPRFRERAGSDEASRNVVSEGQIRVAPRYRTGITKTSRLASSLSPAKSSPDDSSESPVSAEAHGHLSQNLSSQALSGRSLAGYSGTRRPAR